MDTHSQQGRYSAAQPAPVSANEWQQAAGGIGSVSLRLSVKCNHCATAVPLNGPTQLAHCDNCLKDSPLTQVPEELALAAEGYKQLGSSYSSSLYSNPDPECSKCDTAVPIAQYLNFVGATATIPCPSCGTGCPTYPAPAWLKERLPGALQIFGGDPQTAKEEGGLVVDMPVLTAQPVVMTCPSCTGALTITAENERTTNCPYCQISVFLPDELWKRMHPARTMQRWTLSYSGKLKTAEDLESDAESEREELQRRESQEQVSMTRRRTKKKRKGKGWLITVTSLVGFALAYLFGGPHAFMACGSVGDHAMDKLRACDQATQLLGDSIDITYGISYGSMETSGDYEEAYVTIPVKGSKSRGSYSYSGLRRGNRLEFSGTLDVDGQTVDIGTCPVGGGSDNSGSNTSGGSDNSGSSSVSDNSERNRTYNDIGCACIAEGEEDRKVVLRVSVDDDSPEGPFQTFYKVAVGDKEFKLATTDHTAPKNLETKRKIEFAVHCGSDRLVVGNQDNVTAWSLDDGHALWSTPINRKLNLLGNPPPKKNFSLTCRNLKARRGKLKIPTGKSKRVVVDVETGEIKKRSK